MPRTLALLVFLFPLSASATLVATPPVELTARIVDAAPYAQEWGRIAGDGDGRFAVWVDTDHARRSQILGVPVAEDGSPIGEARIISTGREHDRAPAIAAGAGRYLAAWHDEAGIRARLVETDGRVTGEPLTFPAGINVYDLEVAFNGEVFLVVWLNTEGYHGAIVDVDGRVVREAFPVALGTSLIEGALTATGETFRFVASEMDRTGTPNENGYPSAIFSVHIDANGTVSPRTTIQAATEPVYRLQAASRGSELAVAWSTGLGTARTEGRIERGGIIEGFPAANMWVMDLAADERGFVVYYGNRDGQLVKRAGQPVITPLPSPEGWSWVEDTAAGVVLYGMDTPQADFGPADYDLYGGTLEDEPVPLATSPRLQAWPDAAPAGALRLAAWAEYHGTEQRVTVMAARFDAAGTVLDGAGIPIGGEIYRAGGPAVASNGADWLVVWQRDVALFARRVTRQGGLPDAEPIVIADGIYRLGRFDVAWDGTSYVVVFVRGTDIRGLQTTVHATRIGSDGTVLGEVQLAPLGDLRHPAIAGSPLGSLVVWERASSSFLDGIQLSHANAVTPVSFGAAPGGSPAVAWNGSTFLVAGHTGHDAVLVTVNANGVAAVTSTLPEIGVQRIDGSTGQFVLALTQGDALFAAIGDTPQHLATISMLPAYVGLGYPVALAGRQVVYARSIGHPVRDATRLVLSSIVEAPAPSPRRRARH